MKSGRNSPLQFLKSQNAANILDACRHGVRRTGAVARACDAVASLDNGQSHVEDLQQGVPGQGLGSRDIGEKLGGLAYGIRERLAIDAPELDLDLCHVSLVSERPSPLRP